MNNKYKEKPVEESSILSATKPKQEILRNNNSKPELKTRLMQKKKILIYVDGSKYYVEHATAYALGLINTRAIMLDSPKLVEISPDMHNKLKSQNDIEIEYVNKVQDKKPKLQVFVSDSKYYIQISAAYALGLITVEEFNATDSKYYCLDEKLYTFLKEK